MVVCAERLSLRAVAVELAWDPFAIARRYPDRDFDELFVELRALAAEHYRAELEGRDRLAERYAASSVDQVMPPSSGSKLSG